jgi:hypothetical protein
VVVPLGVGDTFDALMPPTRDGIVRCTRLKGVDGARLLRCSVQSFQEVLDRWIVSRVANEHKNILLDQLSDEAGRPPLGKVSAAEIRARQDKALALSAAVVSVRDPMKMDNAVNLPFASRVREARWFKNRHR